MIRQLSRVLGPDQLTQYLRYLAVAVGEAVLHGLSLVLLVPLLSALLEGQTGDAGRWLGFLTMTVVAGWVVGYFHARQAHKIGVLLTQTLHRRITERVAGLPLSWFDDYRLGRLSQLASRGVDDIAAVPTDLLRPVFTATIVPATVIIAAFFFDWRLAVAALVIAPALFIVLRWTASLEAAHDDQAEVELDETAARINGFAGDQSLLRSGRRTSSVFEGIDGSLRRQAESSRRGITATLPGLGAYSLTVQLGLTFLIAVAVSVALNGAVDMPAFVALLVLLARVADPIGTLASSGGPLRVARDTLKRLDDVLHTRQLPESSAPHEPEQPEIQLAEVHSWANGVRALDEVSMRVWPGTMTAVVGASDLTKTALVELLARHRDVESGSVRISGVDVRELSSEVLLSQISLICSDVHLVNGTIAENIRIGRADATEEEVREAAQLARVDEIPALEADGWATRVGTGGVALTAGERQRVAVARALLKAAPIVVIDEAVAVMDPENDAAITDGLVSLTADRTVLVFAHRPQTVSTANQIVVFEDGKVVEAGSHQVLLARAGRYAEFWGARTDAQGWRLAPR